MVPADVTDIEARWRPLTAAETAVAEALLEDAWDLLLIRRPDLEAQVDAGDVRDTTVRRVLSWMVRRVLMNPEAWQDEAIDDWRGKRHELVASGILYVSADELSDLTPTTATRPRRHSVRLVVHGDD